MQLIKQTLHHHKMKCTVTIVPHEQTTEISALCSEIVNVFVKACTFLWRIQGRTSLLIVELVRHHLWLRA